MSERFSAPRVRRYMFKATNGSSRPVLALQAGDRSLFIEFIHARAMVDQVHDLADEHERQLREEVING